MVRSAQEDHRGPVSDRPPPIGTAIQSGKTVLDSHQAAGVSAVAVCVPTTAVDDAQRFLEIIARQSDRLNAIIEDLLALSRIEQEAEGNGLPVESTSLASLLQSAIADCSVAAEAKSIEVHLDCPDSLNTKLNAPLLEQAVVNLIDNAIKYSDSGKDVLVRAYQEGSEVRIEVIDQGAGISPQHQPRIFERFYRVDRARSRDLGGTGLGLAIAKHIVIAHRGSISVASELERGSTFTITIPMR